MNGKNKLKNNAEIKENTGGANDFSKKTKSKVHTQKPANKRTIIKNK